MSEGAGVAWGRTQRSTGRALEQGGESAGEGWRIEPAQGGG